MLDGEDCLLFTNNEPWFIVQKHDEEDIEQIKIQLNKTSKFNIDRSQLVVQHDYHQT
jgi:predicted metal-dependent TIM-barrel fold hydrolase